MLECSTCQHILLTISSLPYADTSSLPVEQPHSFQINFNSLYTALCEQQRSDQATLLLYTLLHQNANMRTYMLSRTDMDNLVGGKGIQVTEFSHSCCIFQQSVKEKKEPLQNNASVTGWSLTKHIIQSSHTHIHMAMELFDLGPSPSSVNREI